MKHTLELSVCRVEGAIIRILGLIERRGFAIVSVAASSPETEGDMALTLQVASQERSIDVLTRQIAKLFDVCSVSLLASDIHQPEIEESLAC